MEPLFSHAEQPEPPTTAAGEAPPSRVYRLELPAPRDIVYRAFVEDVHLWWPAAYTGFGEGTHAFVEDGLVGEEGEDGQLQQWAEVRDEEAGRRLEFAWTLGWAADSPTRVQVEVADGESGGTVLTLTQDGWASGEDGVAQHAKYTGWPVILGRFAAFFGQPAESVVEVREGRG